MTLSSGKLSIIHVAIRQLGLDDAAYRDLLWNLTGVRSSRELTPAGFELLMHRFAELGFKSTSRLKPLPARSGMATPAQVQKMRALWAEFTDGQGTDLSLGKWLDSHFKVSSVRFVDAELAQSVIGGIVRMVTAKASRAAKVAQAEAGASAA